MDVKDEKDKLAFAKDEQKEYIRYALNYLFLYD